MTAPYGLWKSQFRPGQSIAEPKVLLTGESEILRSRSTAGQNILVVFRKFPDIFVKNRSASSPFSIPRL
jgi:hypothetical protein